MWSLSIIVQKQWHAFYPYIFGVWSLKCICTIMLSQFVEMLDVKWFYTSCGRGTAITMKNMLESSFPGVEVILANYPPPLPKRLLSKVVPVVQFGIIGTIMAGEHIFPRLGMAPPPWYYSLRANRFGSIASTWLFGNFIQSFLQSSGAFEVYCNGEMVRFFCKLILFFLSLFSW